MSKESNINSPVKNFKILDNKQYYRELKHVLDEDICCVELCRKLKERNPKQMRNNKAHKVEERNRYKIERKDNYRNATIYW